MINAPPVGPDTCWQRVHEGLLKNGVVAESCAEYYFSGPDSGFGMKGFKVRFMPCDTDFLMGRN